MTRELLLLRHGKSDWSVFTGDYDRPLTKRGKRASKTVGRWLLERDGVPDHIVTSPAMRDSTTAQRVAKHMGFDVDTIAKDQRVYGAGVSDILAVLKDCPAEANRVMLVGHNPGLEDMVKYLSCEEVVVPVDGKLMPTATLAWFVFTCSWEELKDRSATLKSITRPGDMFS